MDITGAGFPKLIGVVTAVITLGSGVAFAQPEGLPALEVLRPEVVGARAAQADGRAVVTVDGKLQALVAELLERSPTFRRQWLRLTSVSRLAVHVELGPRPRGGYVLAASGLEVHADGVRHATVTIPGGTRLAERLAHEVEHLLEWLDGAEVATQHALGDGSVRHRSGTFETARATLVGRMVAAELRPR